MFRKKKRHDNKKQRDELEEEREERYNTTEIDVIVIVVEDDDRPVTGHISFKVGENKMSEVTLEVGQTVTATAAFVDATGAAILVDNIVWAEDNLDLATVTPDVNQTAVIVAVVEGVFNVTASTTLPDGSVVTTENAVVTVVAVPAPVVPVAVSGTISFGPVA